MKRPRFFEALTTALLAVLIGGVLATPAMAQGKGGGNNKGGGESEEPVPAGMLYFAEGGVIDGVLADGSVVDPALPFSGGMAPEPSNLLYDGYRLWLRVEETGDTYSVDDGTRTTAQRDLFVYRDHVGSDFVESFQLTGLYGNFIVSGRPRWSNDGEDSFISFRGIDIRQAYDAESNELDRDLIIHGIFRIEISGWEINADEPLIIDPDEVEPIVTSGSGYASNFMHGWSADGTKVVYVLDEVRSSSETNDDLYVFDLVTNQETRIWVANSSTQNPRFSPTDDVISFHYEGAVWTINPDGSEAAVLLPSTPPAFWSPDGNHMSFIETVSKGFQKEYFLNRVSLSSGKVTRVTSGSGPLPWVSNDAFAP